MICARAAAWLLGRDDNCAETEDRRCNKTYPVHYLPPNWPSPLRQTLQPLALLIRYRNKLSAAP
jgi:hypothetical protein